LSSHSSLVDIQSDLRAGKTSLKDIVSHYLEKIRDKSTINAFLEVYGDECINNAVDIDKKITIGSYGKLAGMVVAIKDLLCYENHYSQAGSKILEGFKSSYSATAVQRLLDKDAIIIGRNNCDEFGMGSTNENSYAGPVKNPIDNTRVPGGSSGGSAAAVKAGLCHVALGTDTGGSVRQPAAFCDVIGLKPTYSRISRHGLIAYASSFDTIGIIGNNLKDVAAVLEAIAGADEFDSTVSTFRIPDYTKFKTDNKPLKVALFKEVLEHKELNAEIRENIVSCITKLESAGHVVEVINFPLLEYVLPTYYILTTAEACSNLSRFDGVRFGFRAEDVGNLDDLYEKTRSQGFGKEVLRRIMLGTFVLSASYYDAYYIKAQKVRRLIKNKVTGIFDLYDFILLPTTPSPPYKLGEMTRNPLEMYLADLFTVLASITGSPAISIPSGSTEDGLPIGLQIIAKDFNELEMLSFSNYILGLNMVENKK